MDRNRPLGLRKPPDRLHIEKYPLSALPKDEQTISPVIGGTNWYTNFDDPVLIHTEHGGTIYVIGEGDLGTVRGGHCYCFKPPTIGDPVSWWGYYNQGKEGACSGFGTSRAISLEHRVRYDAFWLYHQAQLVDEFPDTPPEEGSTVRAALSVAQTQGMVVEYDGKDEGVDPAQGVSAYRWATSVEEVKDALGVDDATPFVPILNSWGKDYPHCVHMHEDTLGRLITEDGEFGVPTAR